LKKGKEKRRTNCKAEGGVGGPIVWGKKLAQNYGKSRKSLRRICLSKKEKKRF